MTVRFFNLDNIISEYHRTFMQCISLNGVNNFFFRQMFFPARDYDNETATVLFFSVLRSKSSMVKVYQHFGEMKSNSITCRFI